MADLNQPRLSPAAQAMMGNQREVTARNIAISMANLTPAYYANFNSIVNKYPNISKDLVMAMVQQGLNANTPGLDKIVSIDGITQLKKDALNVDKIKSSVKQDRGILGSIGDAFKEVVYDPFKGVTRVGFAMLRSPYDFATTLTRDAYAIARGEKGAGGQFLKDLAGGFVGESTQLGALARDVVGGKPGVKTGSGFFITPQTRVGKDQARAMAAYGKVAGESFTIGRFAAKQLGVTPNTTGYKILSGLVDASLNVALDPTTWLGAGAATALLKGGKKTVEMKETAALASSQAISKEAYALAQEANKAIAGIRTRYATGYLEKEKTILELEAKKTARATKTIQKVLQQQEDWAKGFGVDKLADETLSTDNTIKSILNNPKTQTGELLSAIDKLSGEAYNTGGFADGFIVLDEVPQPGAVSIGAHQLDEYFVTAVGEEPLKLLDLTEDISKLGPAEKQAEMLRRQYFDDAIKGLSTDANISPEARAIFAELAEASRSSAMQLNGFAWALPLDVGAAPVTLASILSKVAQAKNYEAMDIISDLIRQTWNDIDGFTNIRAIYGETGGVLISNAKKIYANNAQIGNAIAEIADPTDLGPNVAKLIESMKSDDELIAKTKTDLDKALKEKDAFEQRVKEINLFRQYADQDPDLLKQIIDNPDYEELKGIIDLNIRVADKDILSEWYKADVGLTEAFGGEAVKKFDGVLKFFLGRRFAEIAEVVAKETDVNRVRNFFGKKLDAEMVVALTAAKTTDDVYKVFLEHIGAETTDPRLFKSLSLRSEAARMSTNPLARLIDPVSLVPIRYAENLDKVFNRYYVRGTALALNDTTKLVNGVEDWISSTGLKSVLGKKQQEEIIADVVRKLLQAESNQQKAKIIDDTMGNIVDKVSQRLGVDNSVREELARFVKMSPQEKNTLSVYSVNKIGFDEVPTVILPGMGEPVALPGAMLEFQLLNNVVRLPDSKEMLKAFNKYATNQIYGKARAGKVLAEEFGDVWRTAQLVFRISYIWRNIAEMQIRQMFSGHDSLFSHPLRFIAMVMANSGKTGPFASLSQKVARYQYDLADNAFRNVDAEGELMEAVRGYQANAFREGSVSDFRQSGKSEVFKFHVAADSTSPDFFKGLAYTLNRFSTDALLPKVARLMMDGSEDAKRQFVERLILEFDQPNNVLREFVTGAFARNEGLQRVFLKDISLEPPALYSKDNLSIDKIVTYLFDEAQPNTMAGQIKAVAGNGPKSHLIMDIIADKAQFVDDAGKGVVIQSPWLTGGVKTENTLANLEKSFVKVLEKHFTPDDLAGSRVFVQRESALGQPGPKEIKRLVDWFFNYASRLESKYNFGPEYQVAYWDYVGRYARMLSTDDLKYVQQKAQKTLAPVGKTINGKFRTLGTKHPTIRVIEKELKRRLKDPDYKHVGGAKWQTIHQMSAGEASKYVSELFYDASRQKQWAQAYRLLFPFAQAHTNTLYKWSQLSNQNKIPAYRFAKAYNAANQPGSNVVYDATGMTYDENQGFFYTEPGQDKKQFKIPLVGNVLGALAGRNMDMTQALQITAPVASLNLAFGQVNPLLPGFGPAAQMAFIYTGKSETFGTAFDVFRDIVVPFGKPDSIEDVIFPAWLRKSFLYSLGNDAAVERGTKDWAAYLASTGDYGDNPFADDAVRTRLFNDARGLSQQVGLMTALFQSISPATPSTEVLAKIKNPDTKMKFMTMTILYEHWDRISRANPGNYGAAVRQFAETYGKNNIMIALGGSTSAVRGTDDAWSFLNNNPEAADKYARNPGDIVPYFFPGGEYSLKYYNWQKGSGARRPLSTQELANEAEGMVYAMLKDAIVQEQIDNMYPQFWYTQKIAELDKQFGAKPPQDVTTGTAGEKIARVGEALQDRAFQTSSVYKQASEFYTKYTEFYNLLNQLKVSNYAELKGSNGLATIMRNDLIATAERLMMENPAFSRMYYGIFAGQLEG